MRSFVPIALPALAALLLAGAGLDAQRRPTPRGWRAIAQTAIRASLTAPDHRQAVSLLVLDTVSTLRNIRERAGPIAVPFGPTFAVGRPLRQGVLGDLLACPSFTIDARCRFTKHGAMVWVGVPIVATQELVRVVVHVARPRDFGTPGGGRIGSVSRVVRITRDSAGRWTRAEIERTIAG